MSTLRKAASLQALSSEAVCPVRILINLVARENKADTHPEHCNERKSSLKKKMQVRSWVLHCANPAKEACEIKSCFLTPPSLKLLLGVLVTCKSHLGV